MAGIDINRSTSGVLLPREVSTEIWQTTQAQSAVMQLAPQIPLPGGGLDIPIITGDPTAEWVTETNEKPVSRGSLGYKTMRGYTIAVIEPFSNQFRRDLPRLYSALVTRLPGALAKKFDSTVFFGTAPGSDFDTLTGVPAVSLANSGSNNTYKGALAALSAVAARGAEVTGWALSAQGEITALSALDTSGRPLIAADIASQGAVGQILGRPVYRSQAVYKSGVVSPAAPETLGFAGDWSSAMWGQVEGVTISVSDQATLNDGGTALNLWQRNMFAVRAEIEVGFRVKDVNNFVRLTGSTPV